MSLIWNWYRFLLHVPVGIAIARIGETNPAAAISLLISFLAYEITEDDAIGDKAHIDIQGVVGGIILYAIYREWKGKK